MKITRILKSFILFGFLTILMMGSAPASSSAAGDKNDLLIMKTPEIVTEESNYGIHVGAPSANPYNILETIESTSNVFIADNGSTDGTYTDDSGEIQNGDLDIYLFRNDVSSHMDGRLTFAIKIDQYFGEVYSDGTLKNLNQLIANKQVPEFVILEMRIWDVDHDASSPERDYVFVNRTHKIGRDDSTSWGGLEHLTSGNNTWSTLSCTIPISWLKFPEKPAPGEEIEPRENIIQVDIDVLYETYWAITVDWARLKFDDVLIPLVFIHGKGSNSLEWSMFYTTDGKKSTTGGFREWFEEKGYKTFTIDYWSQGNPTVSSGYMNKDTKDLVTNTVSRDYIDNDGDGAPRLGFWDIDDHNTIHNTDIVSNTINDDLKATGDYRFSSNLGGADETWTYWKGLEQMKDFKKAGYDTINIIAHSMGGLVARYYISHLMSQEDYPKVNNLFMISTPNHGSAAAATPVLAWALDQSPSREFLNPKKIEEFNGNYPPSNDVNYYTIGGYGGRETNIPNPWHWYADFNDYSPSSSTLAALVTYMILNGSINPLYSDESLEYEIWEWKLIPYPHLEKVHEPNDDLVTIESSKLDYANATHLGNFYLNHHTIRTDYRVAQAIHDVLQKGYVASTSSVKESTIGIKVVGSPPSVPEIITYSGAISPGETITLTPEILSWSMSCALNWDTEEDLDMVLIDPDGNEVLESNRIKEVALIAYDKIEDIQSGIWTIQIKGENLTQTANYNISIIMYGALVSMSAETNKIIYVTGDAVTVYADIKENQSGASVIDATVTVTIVLPDESTQAITLFDDGTNGDAAASDGRYTNNTFVANTAGDYSAKVNATGSFSGSNFARDRDLSFKAIEPDIQFTGTVNTNVEDTDNNGYYDNLIVQLGVNVIKAGTYTAVGTLFDSLDNEIQSISVTVDMGAGSGTMEIRFSGKLIRENGVDGPYTVKNLILVNENGDRSDEDQAEYNTNSYLHTEFEREDIILSGANTDEGVDTNSNSLYDYLRITIGVDVLQSGTYEYNARLLDGNGNEIVWANGSANLSVGPGNIVLDFSGQNIRRSLTNSPYTVTDLSITGGGAFLSERNVYNTTNAYTYDQFEAIDTDLVAKDITFSKVIVFPGESITISAIIKNLGNPTADTFKVRFYNGNPYSLGTPIGETVNITGLDTNQEKIAEVEWDTTGLSDGNYEIYVHANYDKAITEFDYNNNLAHEGLEVGKMTLSLDTGWNLISLYCQPADTDITNLLSSIAEKIVSVWAYENGVWKVYDPANPGFSNLGTIEAGKGYWLNVKDATILTVSGSAPSNSIELVNGWNLTGYNSSISQQAVANAFASIAGKYVSIWAFMNGGWKVYDPANPGFSDLTTMEPGYGYWINATEASTWTLP